jgi:hypothetical protein
MDQTQDDGRLPIHMQRPRLDSSRCRRNHRRQGQRLTGSLWGSTTASEAKVHRLVLVGPRLNPLHPKRTNSSLLLLLISALPSAPEAAEVVIFLFHTAISFFVFTPLGLKWSNRSQLFVWRIDAGTTLLVPPDVSRPSRSFLLYRRSATTLAAGLEAGWLVYMIEKIVYI